MIKRVRNLLSREIRNIFPERINNYESYLALLKGKAGLEIGGPSDIFKKRGLLPVYQVIANLDGCNFGKETVWEGHITEGPNRYLYHKGKPKGYQYIGDAVNLKGIDNQKYDFILSSHALEHVANPLKAVIEWLRVLKTGGYLLLVVPHRDGTFDHNRPVTSIRHLVDDFEQAMGEDDLGHLQEISKLHDLTLDPAAGDLESFCQRSMKNYENRCLHHHVFDTELVARIMDFLKLKIINIQSVLPYHIVVLALKIAGEVVPDNSLHLSHAAEYRYSSPFPTDVMRIK
jgi:SAM-dependent methyltransferase